MAGENVQGILPVISICCKGVAPLAGGVEGSKWGHGNNFTVTATDPLAVSLACSIIMATEYSSDLPSWDIFHPNDGDNGRPPGILKVCPRQWVGWLVCGWPATRTQCDSFFLAEQDEHEPRDGSRWFRDFS